LAEVKLKPGNTANLAQIYEAVEKNGFANREAELVARGKIVERNGQLSFVVSGTGETLAIQAAKPVDKFREKDVVVSGKLPVPEQGKKPAAIEIVSVQPDH
jgi:hypothetical protein